MKRRRLAALRQSLHHFASTLHRYLLVGVVAAEFQRLEKKVRLGGGKGGLVGREWPSIRHIYIYTQRYTKYVKKPENKCDNCYNSPQNKPKNSFGTFLKGDDES